jgi:hypothetical protein
MKHFIPLLKEFNFVSIINLLGEKKKDEKKLSEYMKTLLGDLPE